MTPLIANLVAVSSILAIVALCSLSPSWLARRAGLAVWPEISEIVATRPITPGPTPTILNAPEAPIVAVGRYRVIDRDPDTVIRWDDTTRRWRDGYGRFVRSPK